MKTAVEWFANRISHGGLVSKKQFDELLEQAKEIHKEQMKKFYGKLQVDENNLVMDFENYYNQTFKQEQ